MLSERENMEICWNHEEPERRMVGAAHDLGMHYMHHSCGYIEPIVPDFVEIGIDAWHSVQPCNDLTMLKQTLGDKLIFAGAVSPKATDSGNGATAAVENGKFDGSAFSFQITIKTPVGELTNELQGTVDGDKLTGTSTNPMGTFELDGVKIG